jgi:hypothetical protein
MAVAAAFIMNIGLGAAVVNAQSYRYESRRYDRSTWRAEQIVRDSYRDILGREPDRSGLRQYVDAIVNRGWSESDVRRSLRQSHEFRERHSGGRYGNGYGYRGDQASEVVRRAYLGVLGREPDPVGMREYRMRVLRDGWRERDVRRALQSSHEYARRY